MPFSVVNVSVEDNCEWLIVIDSGGSEADSVPFCEFMCDFAVCIEGE